MATVSPHQERRLAVIVGASLLVDSLFYTALAPLLGDFERRLHLSSAGAGLLSAAYAIGALAATIPAGLLIGRIGPRATVVGGLSLVTLSTIAFAIVDSPVLLDLARVLEGVGGAGAWAGGLTWLTTSVAPRRRGTVLGQALAAATAGSLLGPMIGALSSAAGRGVAFGLVAVAAGGMAVACRRSPTTSMGAPASARALAHAAGDRRVMATMWLIALPSLISGALSVLGSLRLHHLGAGAGTIGIVFLVAAGLEAAAGPLAGRLSDTRGRRVPIGVGLAAAAGLLAIFGLPDATLPVAVVVIAIAVAIELLWAPAMAWLSSVLEARGDAAGLAGALINLAWAGGQVIGSAGSGALAGATGDAVPMGIAAAIAVVTLAGLLSPRRSR